MAVAVDVLTLGQPRDHPPSGPPRGRVGMTAEACLFVASS